jgi:2-keto-3-deoxy-L-rhamnonate aldolase RhmA
MITQGGVYSNTLKDHLVKGEPFYVFTISYARTADVVGIAVASGHHAICVDLRHSTMSLDTAAQMFQSALALGAATLVRIPSHDFGLVGQLLDAGAQGIVAPDVRSAADAKFLVSACKFPPAGRRSTDSSAGPHTLFEQIPRSKLLPKLDSNTVVIVTLEHPDSVAAADAIAAVDGVDVVQIDLIQLTTALGIPGQVAHDRVRETVETVIAACRSAGKSMILGGVFDPPTISTYVRMGAARCYFSDDDRTLLLEGARRQNGKLRAMDETT